MLVVHGSMAGGWLGVDDMVVAVSASTGLVADSEEAVATLHVAGRHQLEA